jgi:DNA-binding Lrp family transcriptional regulator
MRNLIDSMLLLFGTMPHLDTTDTRMLIALTEDPRSTVVALAEKLGISRNTAQARMARLEAAHAFLPFDRRINPAAMGYSLTAIISVHVQQRMLAAIVEELAGIPEIVQAHGLSGNTDLLLVVVCVDAEDLFRVNGRIRDCAGVERTESSLVMSELIPFRMKPLLERGTTATR